MDSIDITDSAFSLDIPNLNQLTDNNNITIGGIMNGDYTIYFYIGIAIIVVIIGLYIFHNFTKFYQNKQYASSNGEQDCPGGFLYNKSKSK